MRTIVIVNNFKLFNLCYQGYDRNELLVIENTSGRFEGFRQAIQSIAAGLDDKETYAIAHQDVILKPAALAALEDQIAAGNLYGLIGVGKFRKSPLENVVGAMVNLSPSVKSRYDVPMPTEATPVEHIDECVLIIKGRTLKDHLEYLENAWHLYAVELGLRLREMGGQVAVLPLDFIHLSSGCADISYLDTALKLFDKYQLKEIYTTCGRWNRRKLVKQRKACLKALKKQAGHKSPATGQ